MERNSKRIGCALLCLFLALPLAGRAEDLTILAGPADTNISVRRSDGEGVLIKPVRDVSNVAEYLHEKFLVPAPPEPAAPPGSNDLATADGRIYRNVQVWKSAPDGVTIRHDEGLTKVEFPLLPEDWQKKYQYDPETAAAYRRAVADAAQEAERVQQLLREQIAAERAKPVPAEPR